MLDNLIDMHTHSTCSDGSLTPTELINHAFSIGLHTLALTDHDTIDGIKEAKDEAKKLGIQLISGVEISTVFKKGDFTTRELHILGFGLNENNENLKKSFEQLRIYRKTRNEKLLEQLKKAGMNITEEELQNSATTPNITKAHFAKIIVQKGYAKDVTEVFETFFRRNAPTNVTKQCLSPEESIEIIHSGGGVAVLAHPFRYGLEKNQIKELIERLKNCGIDGVEAVYSNHQQEQEDFLKELAKENNLLISGGTDFHGATKPDIELGIGKGNMKIPLSIWTDMQESLRKYQ